MTSSSRLAFDHSGRTEVHRVAPLSLGEAAGAAFERGVSLLLEWIDRSRQRRQLLALDDHQLRDIGISRYDAVHEGRKPFWRA